jgi:signal transduction histidine kinase
MNLALFQLAVISVAVVCGGLFFAHLAARRARLTLAHTMRAASSVVSTGLAASDAEDALRQLTEDLSGLFEADGCAIGLPEGNHLYAYATSGRIGRDRLVALHEGMVGKAFVEGVSIVAPDVRKEPSYIPRNPAVRSAAAVPMRFEGRTLGLLYVESVRRKYREADLAVLEPIADQLGAVVANLRLRRSAEEKTEAERTARRELEAISAVVMAGVAAVNDLDNALRSMLGQIAANMQWEGIAVMLLAGDGRLLTRAAYGYLSSAEGLSVGVGEGICGSVLASGAGRLIADVALDGDYVELISSTRSEMCVPLKVGDQVLGVLNAESRRLNAFSPDDFRLLGALADQVAVVAERAHLADLERQALELLQELDRLKDDFVATVSHELRTPLTSIKGFAETMLARDEELEKEDRRGYLEIVVRQCNRLAGIIDMLLLLSQLEAGEIGGKPVRGRLVDLIEDAVRETEGAERVEVQVDAGAKIVVDQFRLHHVVRNLVENACKYSPKHSPVLVRARTEDAGVCFEVLDRGPGVPADSEDAVFERFRRLSHAGTSAVPGTGLGLYIALRFARDLGGDVTVTRAAEGPWTGARFVLRIPLEFVEDRPAVLAHS